MAPPAEASAPKPLGQVLGDTDKNIRLLVDSVRDYAILLLDAEGRVVSWNKGAERLKGYRAAEVIGKHFSLFYPPEDQQRDKPGQELKKAAETGRLEDEGWRVRKDGSRFWANVVITALRDEDGRLCGFGKVERDLTERKQAEDELRKAREDMERRVLERTADLKKANESLQRELAGRKQAEEAILALSTPVLPVRDRLLILPIIGIIDSQRALQLTEQLLNAIRTYRAKAVVMDITGVPVVDSRVANHLLQTVEAARLMGATVIVTGISPEISQTLVKIGVELGRLRTMGDLRGGLEDAEQLLGYEVIHMGEKHKPSTHS
jgi:PAS domain S-box-containing protein